MKKYKLVKISITLICYFVISNCFAQNIRSTNFDTRPNCEQTGGIWRRYGNSCDNDCQSSFEKYPTCQDALVYSCDCGPNNCWNGKECLTKKAYKITFDQLQRKKSQIVESQKDEEAKLKKSHQKQDPSLFSVIADKVTAPVNSIIKKDPQPQTDQVPIPTNNVVVPITKTATTTTTPTPSANNPIFSVPPVFNQLMDQKAARQLDQAATNSIINTIGNNK